MTEYYENLIVYNDNYIVIGKEIPVSSENECWYYTFSMINIKTKVVTKIDMPKDVAIKDLNFYNNRIYIVNGTICAFSYDTNDILRLYKVNSDGTLEKYKSAKLTSGLTRRYTLTDNIVYTWSYLDSFTETLCYKLSPEK